MSTTVAAKTPSRYTLEDWRCIARNYLARSPSMTDEEYEAAVARVATIALVEDCGVWHAASLAFGTRCWCVKCTPDMRVLQGGAR